MSCKIAIFYSVQLFSVKCCETFKMFKRSWTIILWVFLEWNRIPSFFSGISYFKIKTIFRRLLFVYLNLFRLKAVLNPVLLPPPPFSFDIQGVLWNMTFCQQFKMSTSIIFQVFIQKSKRFFCWNKLQFVLIFNIR